MDLIDILRRQMEGSMTRAPRSGRAQAPTRTGLENVDDEARRIERELGVGEAAPPQQAPRQSQPRQAHPDDVIGEMFDMIRKKGGVGGMADEFRKHGMQEEADSWVGRGTNRPINPRQVETVIGKEELRRMAERLGVPVEVLADALSKSLPEVIDRTTPAGKVEPRSGTMIDEATDFLRRNSGRVI